VADRATLLSRSISDFTISAIITASLNIVATAIPRMAHDGVRSGSLRQLGGPASIRMPHV
jgi:hypothetical protein